MKKKYTYEEFKKIVNESIQAANEAGDKWLENAKPKYVVMENDKPKDILLGNCGFAYIFLKDRRNKTIAQYVDRWNLENRGLVDKYCLRIQFKYFMSPYMELKEECLNAANEVFKKYGIDNFIVRSTID